MTPGAVDGGFDTMGTWSFCRPGCNALIFT